MIQITEHAGQRLAERGITAPEARRVVRQGRIIEQRGNALRVEAMGITVVVTITEDGQAATIITAWREA
jgi:hypothetical protein